LAHFDILAPQEHVCDWGTSRRNADIVVRSKLDP
jgi:hypothetical protein